MSSPSTPARTARRVPVQDRSERRLASFLVHAAEVIARVGIEAATMTEIAARAEASIGAVYQYFPNKEAITTALKRQYVKELTAHWASLESQAGRLDGSQLGASIVELFVEFANERPAFFPLLSVPSNHRKDPAARRRLRRQFAALFQGKNPALTDAEALTMAKVTLQAIRGLIVLCSEARVADRPSIVAEHKALLSGYLSGRLRAESDAPDPGAARPSEGAGNR
jgi:AcrR family transcriptional regulator